MKKLIALAVASAAMASGANAAWDIHGEAMFTAWNTDTQTSVSIDLGLGWADLTKGGVSEFSLTLSDEAKTHLGEGNIRYNIGVIGYDFNDLSSEWMDESDSGVYWVSNTSPLLPNGKDFGKALQAQGSLAQYEQTLRLDDVSADKNDDVYLLEGVKYAGQAWGVSMNGLLRDYETTSFAKAGESVTAKAATFVPGIIPEENVFFADLGTWTFDATSGDLSYVATSEVPVPAAAWMFGSALLGLAGVGRKRKVFAK